METKPTKPAVYGLLISLMLVILNLALYFTNQSMNRGLSSIGYIVLVGGIIYACVQYAKQLGGNVTFGNVFAHGFKVTAVAIVIMVIYTVIFVKLLYPDIIDVTLDMARKNMQEKGKMTEEQINQALEMTRKFYLPFAIGGIIIAFGIIGGIASAIGAAVAKKNPQTPFQQ